MRLWIICSGEAELLLPPCATGEEYAAACKKALDGPIGVAQGHTVAANGRKVYISRHAAARETSERLIPGAAAETEPLLDEIPLKCAQSGRKLPLWLWRVLVWIRGLFGLALGESGRESRKKADALIDRLEKTGADCILVSHPRRIAALCDALRVRGYCVQRTGLGRIKPFEQLLLSRRDEHCGGCAHNCLLSNPGCNIGRDKAGRGKKLRKI